ncbi:MAG: RIP metalloprotease RseP [Gammaproteobacteria bacterium]|nr:RIP metalloprotease RseP [Gammaproteobacteria bacterium]
MSSGGLLHNIIFFAIAIGVLVTFHEFGHYWVARLLNVKVIRFSVGFGKPLVKWTRRKGEDDIEFVIAAIPLGGYVKMLDEREAPVDDKIKHRAFNAQPVINRIAIVAAGPIFNFILAIALYWIVFINGVDGTRPLIGAPDVDTPAALAGFQEEDEILSLGNTRVQTWQAFRLALIDQGIDGGNLNIQVKTRELNVVTRVLTIGDRHILDDKNDVIDQMGFNPVQVDILPVIGGTTSDGAAHSAGLLQGDLILAVDDTGIPNWDQLVQLVQKSPDQTREFLINRAGTEKLITVHLGSREKNGKKTGFMGAYPDTPEELLSKFKTRIEYGPVEALFKAVEKTWSMSALTLRVLGKMLLGEAALENISGPITIATYAGMTASIGVTTYLSFLAIISVSLGVLNLLPVPMLDGGHLFYYLIEMIKGSPVSERFEELGQQIGLALLLMLMGLAIFNDIQRLIN